MPRRVLRDWNRLQNDEGWAQVHFTAVDGPRPLYQGMIGDRLSEGQPPASRRNFDASLRNFAGDEISTGFLQWCERHVTRCRTASNLWIQPAGMGNDLRDLNTCHSIGRGSQ